jgi:hypothetical protein
MWAAPGYALFFQLDNPKTSHPFTIVLYSAGMPSSPGLHAGKPFLLSRLVKNK